MMYWSEKTLSLCIIFAFSSLSALAQKFLTPTNLNAYVNKSDKVQLSWVADLQEKTILNAFVQLLNEQNTPIFSLVNWDGNKKPFVFRRDVIEVRGFGNVTLIALVPSEHKKIGFSIEFTDLSEIKDTTTLIYYEKRPTFIKRLPAVNDFAENDPNNTNLVYSVSASGSPKPEIYWLLNGINVTDIDGMNLSCSSSIIESDYITNCQLHVRKFEIKHNGSFYVWTQYGKQVEISPKEEMTMAIDIKFQPTAPEVKSNLKSLYPYVIINESVTLTCVSDANPHPNYTFIQNIDQGLQKTLYRGPENKFTMSLLANTGDRDRFDTFGCSVTNSLGTKSSAEYSIFVKTGQSVSIGKLSPHQTTVLENSPESRNFTLRYNIQSLPVVTSIKCTLNGKPFEENGISSNNSSKRLFTQTTETVLKRTNEKVFYEFNMNLIVRQLNIEDNGKLSCKVFGEDGMSRLEFDEKIDVQYSPRTISLSANNTETVIDKETYVSFTCSADANPNATYILKSQYGTLYRGSSNTHREFFDEYQRSTILNVHCIAQNEFGNISSNNIQIRFNNETMVKARTDENKESTEWTLYLALGVCVGVFVIVAIMAGTFVFQKRQRGNVAFS